MKTKIQSIELNVDDNIDPETLDILRCFNNASGDPSQFQEMASFIQAVEGLNTFIDAGCSYGAFSLVFSSINKTGTSYAFDGSPNVITTLLKTLELNPQLKIVPRCTLVGNKNDEATCFFTKHQALAAVGYGDQPKNATMITLDSFCQTNNLKPDVIKIDVEGYELNVLLGAENTIREHKPMLFMEIHPRFLSNFWGHTIENIYEFFRTHGYSAFDSNLTLIQDYYNHLKQETTDSNRTIWAVQ